MAFTTSAARLDAQASGLSSDEVAAIARGELVTRTWRQSRRGHEWIGGVSYLRIARPIAEVWAAVHDVAHWHDMLPAATSSRRVDAHDRDPLVELRHAYGPIEARYTVRAHFDERARRCSLDLVPERPHDIDAGTALIEVHPWRHERGSSLVVWAVLADPGSGLLTPLVVDAIQHWAVRVPTTMAAFLEGPGAELHR